MNINSPILNAYGRQVFTAGGPDAHSTHEWGGYWVSLEWFVGRRSTEPMMVIRSAKHDAGMLGICLSSIGKYADPDTPSNAAPGAVNECMTHLDMLGKNTSYMEACALLNVILHFASALIAMPPTPRDVRLAAKGASILDVEITHEETGKLHSEASI